MSVEANANNEVYRGPERRVAQLPLPEGVAFDRRGTEHVYPPSSPEEGLFAPQDVTEIRRRIDAVFGGRMDSVASQVTEGGPVVHHVHERVAEEMSMLRRFGVDAEIVDIAHHYPLPYETQQQVDVQVDALAALPNTSEVLFDPTVHSSGSVWSALSKRAIALHSLTSVGKPTSETLAPDIDPNIYTEKLFGDKSAVQLLERQRGAAKAQQIYGNYLNLISTPVTDEPHKGDPAESPYLQFVAEDPEQRWFLSSREFLRGVRDAQAVDTRAQGATQMAVEHVTSHPELYGDRPVVTASLACGAAGPMFELNDLFGKHGIPLEKHILVDNDPMALASAVGLSRSYGVADKIEVQYQDLIKAKLTDFIEPHSVDIADLLGIVDYLKEQIRVGIIPYNAASEFIGSVKDIMRPGGIIIVGNAVEHRSQQEFFNAVWPPLEQRNPRQMVDIIKNAGFSPDNVKVRVPGREGIYGIYGIELPSADGPQKHRQRLTQLAARKLINFVY